jgi:hypothetical protein
MIKCLSRRVLSFEYLSVYTHVKQSEHKNAHKMNFLQMYTIKKNRSNSWKRVHAWSTDLLIVHMAILFRTRLNAEKVMFLSVYMRFSKFLSARASLSPSREDLQLIYAVFVDILSTCMGYHSDEKPMRICADAGSVKSYEFFISYRRSNCFTGVCVTFPIMGFNV